MPNCMVSPSFPLMGLSRPCLRDTHGMMALFHASSRAIPALKMRRRLTALCGILALFSMVTLATWHDALPHMDDVEHAHATGLDHHARASGHHHEHASGHHSHDDKDDDAGSSDIVHVAAHAVVQGVDVPAQPVVGMTQFAAVNLWDMAPAKHIDSVKPDSLLRPPRA